MDDKLNFLFIAPFLITGLFYFLKEKIFMSMSKSSLESLDKEYKFYPVDIFSQPPEVSEDFCEPFIEKLIRQQEILTCFRDTCNPGISLGLYQYW